MSRACATSTCGRTATRLGGVLRERGAHPGGRAGQAGAARRRRHPADDALGLPLPREHLQPRLPQPRPRDQPTRASRWTGSTCSTTRADLRPVVIPPTRSSSARRGCGYPLDRRDHDHPAGRPGDRRRLVAADRLREPRAVDLRVEAGDEEHDLSLPEGLHNVFVQAAGEFDQVTLEQLPCRLRALRHRAHPRPARTHADRADEPMTRASTAASPPAAPPSAGRVGSLRSSRVLRRRWRWSCVQLAFRAWATLRRPGSRSTTSPSSSRMTNDGTSPERASSRTPGT